MSDRKVSGFVRMARDARRDARELANVCTNGADDTMVRWYVGYAAAMMVAARCEKIEAGTFRHEVNDRKIALIIESRRA